MIAIYMRVSSRIQADSNSTESQAHVIRQWCEGRGIDYAKCERYIDEAMSGKSRNRPAYLRLLDDIETGRVTHVVARDLTRLSRSFRDFFELVDLCKATGCDLSLTALQVDLSTAAGRLMVNMLASFAEWEREMGRERTSEGIRSTMAAGKPWGGQHVGRKHGLAKADPETRAKVIERYRQGETAKALAKEYKVSISTVQRWCKGARKKPARPTE